MNSVVTLASFIVILWSLSNAAPLHMFGKDIDFPGYMVWGALIYAVLGTWLTHLIGHQLVGLDYRQQRYEADFRFNLVRVRENLNRSRCCAASRQSAKGFWCGSDMWSTTGSAS